MLLFPTKKAMVCCRLEGILCALVPAFLLGSMGLWQWVPLCLALGVLLAGWFFPFSLQFFVCREENGRLLWQKGIIWARQGCVLLSQVLSVSLDQTPFQQKWDLCMVVLHLPSGRLILPFLGRSLAEQLAARCACPL